MVDKLFGFFLGGVMAEIKMHPWTTLTAAAALGLVLYSEFDHAKAADVSAIAEQLKDIRAAQVEDKLINARMRYCHAQDDEQRQYFRELVSEYGEQYRKVTGRIYVLPNCNEV